MTESNRVDELFKSLSKVLLRCWVCGLLFVSFWFFLYILAGDFLYRLHRNWFQLTRYELDVIFYCGMGLSKLLVILFFFIPWLAIWMVSDKPKM